MNILFNLHDVYQSYFTSAIKKAKERKKITSPVILSQAQRKTVTAMDIV